VRYPPEKPKEIKRAIDEGRRLDRIYRISFKADVKRIRQGT
jgi:hypothetical protein